MKITRELLIRALNRLGELAIEKGKKLEVCIYGGPVMMLAYDVRDITKDEDTIIHPSNSDLNSLEEWARRWDCRRDGLTTM